MYYITYVVYLHVLWMEKKLSYVTKSKSQINYNLKLYKI